MVLLEFSITPLGKGESVAPYVAKCVEIVAQSGLDYQLHAMGTVLEGEWEQVFAIVQRCYEVLKPDCDRITCSIKVDYRKGHQGRLRTKVEHVQDLIDQPLKTGVPN